MKGELLRCPHGNRPAGNWYGLPPNVRWQGTLACCGISFDEDTPSRALKAFEKWAGQAVAPKNQAASDLGKLGKGVPKDISKAERKRRSERLKKARENRWLTSPKSES